MTDTIHHEAETHGINSYIVGCKLELNMIILITSLSN